MINPSTPCPVREHVLERARHTTYYLACGAPDATPLIFLHGWPELSCSWRHQLPVFGALGFHAIAPDMRGYGRSRVHPRHEDYALEEIVHDMLELLDSIGAERALWVGHDFGAPVVWSLAQHHPERCAGVTNLCVPYRPEGVTAEQTIAVANRELYPEAEFPAAQWDYQLFYREHFERAQAGFEANVRRTIRTLFRSSRPSHKGKRSSTAFVRKNGGWFGPENVAPDLPRDPLILTQEDEDRYAAAFECTGFFGADSWYMNGRANVAYAARAKQPRLKMPVLFLHAERDNVCETLESRLADAMRASCGDLTEAVVASGHWMAQERPVEVNAVLARWLGQRFPELWRVG